MDTNIQQVVNRRLQAEEVAQRERTREAAEFAKSSYAFGVIFAFAATLGVGFVAAVVLEAIKAPQWTVLPLIVGCACVFVGVSYWVDKVEKNDSGMKP